MAKNTKKQNKNRNAKASETKDVPEEIQREKDHMIQNGLSEALFGPNMYGETSQLSQAHTLFKNTRWYLVSNMRELLSEIYVEYGLIQTIIDVPVNDGLRGGIEIQTELLNEDEISKLQKHMDRSQDLKTVGQGQRWSRLYGGGAILIITNEDAHKPFDVNNIKKGDPVDFKAVEMWELYSDQDNIPETDGRMGDNLQVENKEHFVYYGKKVHSSRVMLIKGLEPPSFIRPRLRGWGVSVVEAIVPSINQYLKATNLSFEVLDEFKLDIFKMKNLVNTLIDPSGTAKVKQRVDLANKEKNYQNAIVMDAEDDYQQKQLSFAGLGDVMQGIRLQVASDLRMPLTKLFGISSAGFSSGEDDIENYNSMIESDIRTKAKWDILKIVEIRCMELFGHVPEDLEISFQPLRVLSSEQEENVKTLKFNRLIAARQSGEISSLEFAEACNRDDLLPIRLDTDDRETGGLGEDLDDLSVDVSQGKTTSKLTAPEVESA